MDDLFGNRRERGRVDLAEDAVLLPAYADGDLLYRLIEALAAQSPFRKYVTRSGFALSVAMSNCGSKGWVSDRRGYRYETIDPLTGKPWPPMPNAFVTLAHNAAREAGFTDFTPNACLINRYEAGTKMGLHQDKDEKDFAQPIVSVSIGLMARFQFGGSERNDPLVKHELHHGDVVVWGGKSRLNYHGIMPLKAGEHALTGPHRYNLTFRYASDS
jgi:alkylated DNA repair protein (DNA oxidative demethylase)